MTFSELIALYLFLGGTAAGAFVLMAAGRLWRAWCAWRRGGREAACAGSRGSWLDAVVPVSRWVYGVALAMMVAGLLCLLADLGRPEAFYLLFTRPSGSVMSIGAIAVASLTLCMGLTLACELLVLGPFWRKAALVAEGVGCVAAVVVMAYAGMLLQTVVAVPLWQSDWLWVLFLLSSLSCGCAVILLCACACRGYAGAVALCRRSMALDAAFIVMEAAATVAFSCSVDAACAVQPFRALAVGGFAALFWLGFVGCGMLLPLMAEAALLRRHASGAVVATVASSVLAGGLCLRLVMVGAGVSVAM